MKIKLVLVAVSTVATSACSSLPAMPGTNFDWSGLPFLGGDAETAEAPLADDATPRQRLSRAIVLLDAGQAEAAKSELKRVLAASPRDATAQRLLSQIETDPEKLLGAQSYAYTVVAGDTMSAIAEKHLGDALMFYALSRYNGLASPRALGAGQILRMPGSASAKGAPAAAVATLDGGAASRPAGRAIDAEKASAIRLKALELLNRGEPAQAVKLLRQAAGLNETDAAIRRDLERAVRIESTLAD